MTDKKADLLNEVMSGLESIYGIEAASDVGLTILKYLEGVSAPDDERDPEEWTEKEKILLGKFQRLVEVPTAKKSGLSDSDIKGVLSLLDEAAA